MALKCWEEFDLSQSSLGKNLLAEDVGHLLDSNTFSILAVGGRAILGLAVSMPLVCADLPDNTIRSLAQLFCHGVSVVHDEILVKYLEDLPATQVTHFEGFVAGKVLEQGKIVE